jgi:hypothetical protein
MAEVTVSCPDGSLSDLALKLFEQECRAIHAAYAALAHGPEIPRLTEVLITADLEKTVRKQMRTSEEEGEGAQFEASRFGLGRVAGKNLAQDAGYDHVVIVFDSAMWSIPDRTPFVQSQGFLLIAHEMAHPLLARIRIASGVAADVVYPSYLPGEIARSLGRILMDEYRADWMADLVLRSVASKGQGGDPLGEWDLDGLYQFGELKRVMSTAYTEMPATVSRLLIGQTDLMTMWSTVTRWTEHVLTAYVHVRAAADGADQPVAILDETSFAALPFVRLYLSDTITPFIQTLRQGPVLPTAAEWGLLEAAVTAAAESMIREIWRRLGLTFVEPPTRGEYRIKVDAPLVVAGGQAPKR